MNDSAQRMWAEFESSGMAPAGATYTAWHFGSGGAMADELAELVLSGRKRATAGALWSYEAEDEALPQVGDHSIILDGAGTARCIIRTASIEVVPFDEVSEEFAATEGEGDSSLEYWREGHWHFFTLDLAQFGREPHEKMPVVCERFELVWPTRRS